MENELVQAIRKNAEVMFTNADIMLKTCDQWYINPHEYTEPDFHEPNLNSLDIPSEKVLSKEELARYLDAIRTKILAYLDSLTDEMLYEIPNGCKHNRLSKY